MQMICQRADHPGAAVTPEATALEPPQSKENILFSRLFGVPGAHGSGSRLWLSALPPSASGRSAPSGRSRPNLHHRKGRDRHA
jgi:hypothetical protein